MPLDNTNGRGGRSDTEGFMAAFDVTSVYDNQVFDGDSTSADGRGGGSVSSHLRPKSRTWDPRTESVVAYTQQILTTFKEDQARMLDTFKEKQAKLFEHEVAEPIQQALAIHDAEQKKQAEFAWRTREEDLQNEHEEEIWRRTVRHTEYVDALRDQVDKLRTAKSPQETPQLKSSILSLVLGQKRHADTSFAKPPPQRQRTGQGNKGHHDGHIVATSNPRPPSDLLSQHQVTAGSGQTQAVSRGSVNHTWPPSIHKPNGITNLTAPPVLSDSKRIQQLAPETCRAPHQTMYTELDGVDEDDESH